MDPRCSVFLGPAGIVSQKWGVRAGPTQFVREILVQLLLLPLEIISLFFRKGCIWGD